MTSKVVNNNARDIKRKLDVISKKCQELKGLGVAVAVAYSTTKTNGLYVFGDERISKVVQKYKDEILLDPDWQKEEMESSSKVLLPPLPDSLYSLNGITMKALIRGIMKDLKLSWNSDKPEWWPDTVPFVNVTQPAPEFEGNWSIALREIITACYTHHGLDVRTYIQPDAEDTRECVPVPRDLQIEDDGSRGPQIEDDGFRDPQDEDDESAGQQIGNNKTRQRKRPDFTPLAVRKPKRQRHQPQRLE